MPGYVEGRCVTGTWTSQEMLPSAWAADPAKCVERCSAHSDCLGILFGKIETPAGNAHRCLLAGAGLNETVVTYPCTGTETAPCPSPVLFTDLKDLAPILRCWQKLVRRCSPREAPGKENTTAPLWKRLQGRCTATASAGYQWATLKMRELHQKGSETLQRTQVQGKLLLASVVAAWWECWDLSKVYFKAVSKRAMRLEGVSGDLYLLVKTNGAEAARSLAPTALAVLAAVFAAAFLLVAKSIIPRSVGSTSVQAQAPAPQEVQAPAAAGPPDEQPGLEPASAFEPPTLLPRRRVDTPPPHARRSFGMSSEECPDWRAEPLASPWPPIKKELNHSPPEEPPQSPSAVKDGFWSRVESSPGQPEEELEASEGSQEWVLQKLNSRDLEDIKEVKNIGDTLARRIFDYTAKGRRISSLEDLARSQLVSKLHLSKLQRAYPYP